MRLGPGPRRAALTAHVTASVGWLGAVAAFLALAVAGLASADAERTRALFVAMELIGWLALVPLSFASLATGVIGSLGTAWGLFRHYWVVAKLGINLLATLLLLVYMVTLEPGTPAARLSPVLHSAAALGLLLVATALGIYKPRGLTGYGRRKQRPAAVR